MSGAPFVATPRSGALGSGFSWPAVSGAAAPFFGLLKRRENGGVAGGAEPIGSLVPGSLPSVRTALEDRDERMPLAGMTLGSTPVIHAGPPPADALERTTGVLP